MLNCLALCSMLNHSNEISQSLLRKKLGAARKEAHSTVLTSNTKQNKTLKLIFRQRKTSEKCCYARLYM